jgi:RNA recognition motif-containing protein
LLRERIIIHQLKPIPKDFGVPPVSACNRSREPPGLLSTFIERTNTMSAKLFIGNLSPDTTRTELSDLFGQVGVVDSCTLIVDRETERSRGFGFIEMDSQEAANAAKEKFNGQDLHGKQLKVNDAKPRTEYQNNTSRRY